MSAGGHLRPTLSTTVAVCVSVVLAAVMMFQVSGPLAAGLGVVAVVVFAVGLAGRAVRSSVGDVLAGLGIPVAATAFVGAVALPARGGPPAAAIVAVAALTGCWLLLHAAAGGRPGTTPGATARRLVIGAVIAGVTAALIAVGGGTILGELRAAVATITDWGPVTDSGGQVLVLIADAAALLFAAFFANATISRLEIRYLGTDTHVTVVGWRLSALLTWATAAAFLLVSVGVLVAALAPTVSTAALGFERLLRLFLGVVAAPWTHVAGVAVAVLALVGYIAVRLVEWGDKADSAGTLRRASVLPGPVGVGIAAALVQGRYAAALATTPLGDAVAAIQVGALAAGPLLVVGGWLGLLAVGLGLAKGSTRGFTAIGSAFLGLAAPFTTLAGGGPLLCLGGVAVAVLVWDLQETAIGLSEQLGATRPLLRNEVFRGGASLVVTLLAVGIGYGVFRAVASAPADPPSPLIIIAVLGGTALLSLVLVRRLSVGGVDVGD